ncbi:MAG: cytochrome c biogenesis protein CcsA [Phycisphaerae bacterium]|nr:cytochrome c biogenesis protein CcsA [Phycisphaerae bacterium]
MIRLFAILMAATVVALPARGTELPQSIDPAPLKKMVVQFDGRWPPLDTLARDVVEDVTGETYFRGRAPVVVLLAWTFDPRGWMTEPLIPIHNAELRAALKLPADKEVFSFAELAGHDPLMQVIREAAALPEGQKLDPLQSKGVDINGKLMTLQSVFQGGLIRPIPNPEDAGGVWSPIGAGDGPLAAEWGAVRSAFLADDASAFANAAQALTSKIAAMPAAYRPPPSKISTELHYNELRPFRTAWIVMVAGAVLSAIAMFVRRRWFDVIAVVGMLAGFGLLTYGLSLRWTIAGRIPAANMFESLLFLSWGMGAFAIVAMIVQRQRIVPLTASAMGALALALADVLPLDHFVRPVPPVLMDTMWMSIHVPTIMVSYSVLALGVLFAHLLVVAKAVAPNRSRLIGRIDAMHYWYIHVGAILLFVGIVTGSMWAASSWGRYWGWDPKEVWSLVALLGYLAIMHVRIDKEQIPAWAYVVGVLLMAALFTIVVFKLGPASPMAVLGLAGAAGAMMLFVFAQGIFATAVKSIVCFWLIVMTYVGVNYVLGIGLHSYGFGTGAMGRWMMLIGGVDLAFVALFSGVYLIRRAGTATGEGHVARLAPA